MQPHGMPLTDTPCDGSLSHTRVTHSPLSATVPRAAHDLILHTPSAQHVHRGQAPHAPLQWHPIGTQVHVLSSNHGSRPCMAKQACHTIPESLSLQKVCLACRW